MTTAHRPTWNAAIGHGTNPSGNLLVAHTQKVSVRDLPSNLKLKERQTGQGVATERGSKNDFREQLEIKEKKAKEEKDKKKTPAQKERERLAALENNPFPEDADDLSDEEKEKSEDDNDDDDDDDDDTEDLMRELAKIKAEREAEEAQKKAEEDKMKERQRREEVFKGNPLLESQDFSLKRKWDDDTVFKNQARTAPKKGPGYINDMMRSEFHKKFLNKYVYV